MMNERSACYSDSQSGDKQPCDASFSSSFEIYAAIGGDPDINEVGDLFIAASKAVLNIQDESNRPTIRSYRRSTRRNSVGETKTLVNAEVDLMDCDKLGIYFSSEDGIRCFSIVVSVLVTSDNGNLCRVSSIAENLAFAAELAFTNGEFEQRLKDAEGDISVLLVEMAPESSSNGEEEGDFHDKEEEDDHYDDEQEDCFYDSEDDSSSISSMDPNDFDDFLETSYREYLQDQNRQEILSKIQPPISPCTVLDFPAEHSKTSPYAIDLQGELKTRMETKVKFDPVVRVKNTLSRHDMTPKEMDKYWSSGQESLPMIVRERILKTLTDRWTQRKEQESKEENLEASSSSILIPILPAIKQLLPESEREGHDGYTYTMSIRN